MPSRVTTTGGGCPARAREQKLTTGALSGRVPVGGVQPHPLHRGVDRAGGTRDVDGVQGLLQVAGTAVGQGQLLVGDRPVLHMEPGYFFPRVGSNVVFDRRHCNEGDSGGGR